MNSPTTNEAPIFVTGSGRSGTTLLRLMLSAHPRIYICHEPWFYIWSTLCPGSYTGDEFLQHYFQTFSFRWLRVPPKDVMAALPHPLPRKDLNLAFREIMRLKAASLGKQRFGEKTPAHVFHLRKLYRDFPDARVIVIVRDPRTTVASMQRMPWGSQYDLPNCITYEGMAKYLRPHEGRFLLLRLEDLQADPEATMRRALEFVGEEWDDAVLDHSANNPDPDDMPDVPWLQQSARPLVKSSPSFADISPARIRAMEMMCKRSMKEWGYAPAEIEDAPGSARTAWNLIRQLPGSIRFGLTAARRMRTLKDPANWGTEITPYGWMFRGFNPAWERANPAFEFPTPPPLQSSPPVQASASVRNEKVS